MFKTIDEQIEYLEKMTNSLLKGEGLNTPAKKRQYAAARQRLEELRLDWLDIDDNKLPRDPYYDMDEKVSYHPHCLNCEGFPAGSEDCRSKPDCEDKDA